MLFSIINLFFSNVIQCRMAISFVTTILHLTLIIAIIFDFVIAKIWPQLYIHLNIILYKYFDHQKFILLNSKKKKTGKIKVN